MRDEKKQVAQSRVTGAKEAGQMQQTAVKARASGRARGRDGVCRRSMRWQMDVEELFEN